MENNRLSLFNKTIALLGKRVSKWSFTLFLLLSLIFFFYSCSNKQIVNESGVTVIDFVSGLNNPRIIDLSEIATDIEYIPLETTKESLIGPFPTISTGNNRIYVMTGKKNVQIFDKKGKYLFTFNRTGRGPEEYIVSTGFQFEEKTGNIIVNTFTQDFTPFAITYDSLGRFLFSESTIRIDSAYLAKPIKINDSLYLGPVPGMTRNKLDFWIIAFKKDGSVLKKFPSPPFKQQDYLNKQAESSRVSIGKGESSTVVANNLSPRLYRIGNYTRVFSRYLDTLYTINAQLECNPEFVINYGNIKADGTSSNISIGEIMDEGDFIILIEGKYQEWKNNILFNYTLNKYAFEPYETSMTVKSKVVNRKHTDAYALYNSDKGEFTFMKQPIKGKLGFRDNLMGGPPFIPQFITEDGKYAVSLLSAQDILEHAQTGQMKDQIEKIASKIDDMGNPVVAIVKLK